MRGGLRRISDTESPPTNQTIVAADQHDRTHTNMYKDEPDDIHLSIDGDEYEFDENRLQYKKGKRPKTTTTTTTPTPKKPKRSKKGGGDCSDWLCKKSIRYRFGYSVVLALVLALVFTTPRTTLYLPPLYESYNWASCFAFGTVLAIMLGSYWMVQNSDPGFLTEIISPDEAVLYSSDAFRAHLMKSEWGDEDDGTWDDSVKNIMHARTKFTDEDLENAERQAEQLERKSALRTRKTPDTTGSTDGSEAGNTKDESSASFPTYASNDRIVNTKYGGGEDNEIEGLLYHETGVAGKKIKAYLIDTKHPDLPYRAIYCKAERRWVGKKRCLVFWFTHDTCTCAWSRCWQTNGVLNVCYVLSCSFVLYLSQCFLLRCQPCTIIIVVCWGPPLVKRTMLDFGGIYVFKPCLCVMRLVSYTVAFVIPFIRIGTTTMLTNCGRCCFCTFLRRLWVVCGSFIHGWPVQI